MPATCAGNIHPGPGCLFIIFFVTGASGHNRPQFCPRCGARQKVRSIRISRYNFIAAPVVVRRSRTCGEEAHKAERRQAQTVIAGSSPALSSSRCWVSSAVFCPFLLNDGGKDRNRSSGFSYTRRSTPKGLTAMSEEKAFLHRHKTILQRRGLDPKDYVFVKETYVTLFVRNIHNGQIKIINKQN